MEPIRQGEGDELIRQPVKAGDELTVKIETIGAKGDGIAKVERYTIFVPNTKEGDEVKIRIKAALPRFAFAEVIE